MLFIKIAVSFTSLIPCPILPREHRENSERTPQLQKVLFVKIAIYVFGHEWRFFCVCTCKNEKNVLPLHREKIVRAIERDKNLRWGCLHISGEGKQT